ncbi:MAG TPA: hypothetical protein VJ935_03360 [Acidimicrobiia bacterium]|nr:hypothetical protein [Acidimicrobiia bacterium]
MTFVERDGPFLEVERESTEKAGNIGGVLPQHFCPSLQLPGEQGAADTLAAVLGVDATNQEGAGMIGFTWATKLGVTIGISSKISILR